MVRTASSFLTNTPSFPWQLEDLHALRKNLHSVKRDYLNVDDLLDSTASSYVVDAGSLLADDH